MAKDSFQFEITPELKTDKFDKKIQGLLNQARAGSEQAADELNRILGGKKYDRIQVGVDMDTKEAVAGVKTIRTEYDKLNKLMDKAEKTDRRSLTSLKGRLRTYTQQRDAISKTVMVTDKYGKKVRKLNQAWVKQNALVNKVKLKIATVQGDIVGMATAKFPLLGKIGSMAGKLNAIVMGAQAAGIALQAMAAAAAPLINRQKQVDGLSLALQGFGLSAQESNMVLQSSKEISLKYGASLSSIEKAYKRIAPTIIAAGGSLADTGQVIEAMAARTATLGLNTEQSGRYMEAFAQVMGKGKLQSEELNQQFSELDGSLRGQIAGYLEAKHGITDLEKAMQNGQVSADIFREAFVEISKPMKEQLGGAITNIQSRIDSMNVNQVQNVVDTLNTMTLDSLRETFSGFGNSLKQSYVAVTAFVTSLATDMPAVQQVVKSVFTVIGGVIEVTVGVIVGTLKVMAMAVEANFRPLVNMLTFIRDNKFTGPLVRGIENLVNKGVQGFRWLVGAINKFGNDGVDGATRKLTTLEQSSNIALENLKRDFESGKISAEEFKQKTDEVNQKLAEMALQEGVKAVGRELQVASGNFQAMAQNVISGLQNQNEMYSRQKDLIQQNKKEVIDSIDEQIAKAKEYHDQRIQQLNDQLTAIREAKAEELGVVNEMTAAEKQLEQLRMNEIRDKLRSGDLTRRERLELQARLDGMKRTIAVREINARYADKEKNAAQEVKNAERDRKNQMKDLGDEKKRQIDLFDSEIERLNRAIQMNKNYITDIKTFSNEMKEFEKEKTRNLDKQAEHLQKISEGTALLQQAAPQIGIAFESMTTNSANTREQVVGLRKPMEDVKKEIGLQIDAQNTQIGKLDTLIEKTKILARESAKVKIGGGEAPRAAGGPVLGGSTYQVNELGKEAFLSASGKLSMINAPAYGKWRAPSSGVVIPAHLTSQLDIPSGGININQNVAARSGSIRPSVNTSSVRHGDNFNNTVTIQSSNPTQTANSMMVQLQKIKRNRLGR